MRTYLVCILYLFILSAHSQVRNELIWTANLNDDSEEEYRRNFTRISRAGFKLNLEALKSGEVVMSFTDLTTLTRNIPGGADGISFNYVDQNGTPSEIFINRRAIHEQLKQTLELFIDDKLSRIRLRGSPEDYRKKERKDFQQVLRGKKRGVKWRGYSWPVKLGNVQNLNPKMPYGISFICKRVPYADVNFDSLYSDLTPILPQLDNEVCEPFDRYTYYRRYFGLSYEGISYKPYRPRSGINRKKNFRLFFDKASATYDQGEIDRIIKYLNDSNLVIKTAKVLAFASVEGDSAINMRLQRDRAMVLMRTLEKANNDTIEISLNTREDWSQFESQLARTPFKDRYSKSEWKDLLENDSIEAKFEKYLKRQRRAELYLTLTQRLTEEQKIKIALYDFKRYIGKYQPQARAEVRWKQVRNIYAIKKYLDIQAARGQVDKQDVCSIFPPSINEYHIVQFYETAKIIRDGKQPVCDNLDDIIRAAHFSVLDLIKTHGENRLYLQQALDLQSFIYEMAGQGKIDNEILCELEYPDESHYYNLTLNNLFFREHQGNQIYENLSCFESYTGDVGSSGNLYASTSVSSAADRPKSSYYFVLKKIVLENSERIKQLVTRSDHILQFDLFEFLFYNISNWSVWDKELFDEEVTPEIMSQQLMRLRSMKGRICPNQVNALTLHFYLKVMHSSLVNVQADELTNDAIDFVSHYYQNNADKMDDRLALVIAKQLMALTPLYFQNEPAHEAYDVLRLKNWKEPLRGEALNYYMNLVNLVARDREDRMEALKIKFPEKVWESFFTGKYSIETDPTLE